MGDPMVSSSTGAMNSLLLHKLRVVEEQYPELAQGLRESLKSLSDVLHSFARQRASLNDSLVNQWMLQVRELVYDMEDWIDGDPSNSKPNLDDVEEQIQEFKAQIQGALDRCTRYDLLSSTNTVPATTSTSNCAAVLVQDDDAETSRESSLVAMDPKLLHGEAPCRFMAGPMNVLVNHLMDQQERRKVVCILGTGGIGKSTLATGIYRQLQGHFSCGAFVHLGRNPSVKTTLISILKQVMPDWHCQEYLWNGYNSEDMEAWDEKKVITKLWAFLKTKSYFVVLVDMRSISNWKKISCALPNKHKSSDRILITTCTKDVAESCCIHPTDFVHPMDRLSDKDSKTLFQSKVPDSEQHRLLDQVSDDMLEMCGRGVPLAITITAALLSRKSACFPRPDQCRSTPQSQWMRKVLEISYDDLPLPLKSCFLYLTAFSANHTIKKDRLIRRWEAEGLIAKRDGESLWETGESYFNELINRRLIQPEFDDDNDEPTGCTVHGVVLDFMESLSAEENFTTQGAKLKCGLFPYERVRRIFLDCGEEEEGDALFCSKYYCSLEQKSREEDSSSEESSVCDQDEAISLHLSQVRSLAFCGDVGRIPDLSDFKLVRVLDLSDVKGLQNQQLESIARLSLLRYLALGGADVTELPQEIMELDHLSSLDLRQTEVKKLPEFKGTNLACLLANGLTIPGGGGMGEMEELEELSTVCVGRDGSLADNVAGLVNQLMRLRMLGVRFRITYNNTAEEAERQGIKHLMEEVGKSNLQLLFLDEYPHRLLDLLVDCWSHVRPRYLRKFELRLDWLLCPVKVPQDITLLIDLTHLHIGVSIVEDAEGVRALGGLPKLVLLKLHSLRPQHGLTGESQSPARLSVSSKDGFQRLKVLWYVCEHGAWTGLQFEEGAMPQLRRLFIDFQSSEEDTNDFVLGIQHFSCLVQVRATIYYEPKPTTSTQVSAAEKHIREQVSQNPNNPVLEFNRKRKGCLVRRLGPPSNEKPSAVIKIHSLDEWTIMTELEAKNKLVVVEFTASWCGPSRSIAPFFAYLANKFPDAIFLKVDIDDMKYIAEAYKVSGAPIFLFMNKGEVKDRLSGAHKEELIEKLELQMALLVDN